MFVLLVSLYIAVYNLQSIVNYIGQFTRIFSDNEVKVVN
jgi:hypothetical protein